MARQGGFRGFWVERDRLLLEGARPVDEISTTAIPLDRWVAVEVVASVKIGLPGYSVRDSSGRTANVFMPGGLTPPRVGDRGRFRRSLAPGSPRILRLQTERGFAAVGSDGALLQRSEVLSDLLPLVKEIAEFHLADASGRSPR